MKLGDTIKRLQKAISSGIAIDSDIATIERDGVLTSFNCRVSNTSETVWDRDIGDTGAPIDTTPYGFTDNVDIDIRTGDILQWRNGWYQVGTVTTAGLFGCSLVKQFILKEVEHD